MEYINWKVQLGKRNRDRDYLASQIKDSTDFIFENFLHDCNTRWTGKVKNYKITVKICFICLFRVDNRCHLSFVKIIFQEKSYVCMTL